MNLLRSDNLQADERCGPRRRQRLAPAADALIGDNPSFQKAARKLTIEFQASDVEIRRSCLTVSRG